MSTNNNISEQFPGFLLKTLCTAKKLLKNAAEYVTIYSVLFSAVIFPAKGSAPLGTQHRTGRTSDTPEHRQYRPHLRRHRSKAPPDTSDGLHPDDKQLKRAGLDYWHYLDITYYDGLDDFFSKNDGAYFYFSTKAVNTYSDVSYPDKCFLFFGREDAGLPEKLLFENKESCVRIPMRETLRSLNLSNSVAIGVYEVLRQWGFPELQNQGRLREFDWNNAD